MAQRIGEREQPGTAFAPPGRPLAAALAFGLVPPDGAAGHFLVYAVLTGSDVVGEKRQGLAFEALLAQERRAFARRVSIGFGSVPATEAHHAALLSMAVSGSATGRSSSGRKDKIQSAALLACEAARTMTRLSARIVSIHAPM